MPNTYNRKKEFIKTRKNILMYGREGAMLKRRFGTHTPWTSANPNIQKAWKKYASTLKKVNRNKSGKKIRTAKKGITTIKNFNFSKKKQRKPKSRKTIAGLNVEQVVAAAKELEKEATEKELQMENNASGLRRSTRTRKAPVNTLAETKKAENARKARMIEDRKKKTAEIMKKAKEEKKVKEEAAKGPHFAKSHVSTSALSKTVKKSKRKPTATPMPSPAPLSVIPESPKYSMNENVNKHLAERFAKIRIENNNK
jgi:hypothetical protein